MALKKYFLCLMALFFSKPLFGNVEVLKATGFQLGLVQSVTDEDRFYLAISNDPLITTDAYESITNLEKKWTSLNELAAAYGYAPNDKGYSKIHAFRIAGFLQDAVQRGFFNAVRYSNKENKQEKLSSVMRNVYQYYVKLTKIMAEVNTLQGETTLKVENDDWVPIETFILTKPVRNTDRIAIAQQEVNFSEMELFQPIAESLKYVESLYRKMRATSYNPTGMTQLGLATLLNRTWNKPPPVVIAGLLTAGNTITDPRRMLMPAQED